MAPYDDYLKRLQSVTGTDWEALCEDLQQYIEKRMAYEEERRGQDTDRRKALASLLNAAFEISKKANAIRMHLDDLSDILEQTRALAESQAGGSSESSVEEKDIIRELGLLFVTDSEKQQRLVLIINGGGSLEGTRGSVTAPGESTPVFMDNWSDVRFIAHTHPNERALQTDAEFKADVEAANRESKKYDSLKRAELVHREQITEGIGGTIFYTGDGVLSEKNDRQYRGSFAVRADNLSNILDEDRKYFAARLTEEQRVPYEGFVQEFTDVINQRIVIRDKIADALKREI